MVKHFSSEMTDKEEYILFANFVHGGGEGLFEEKKDMIFLANGFEPHKMVIRPKSTILNWT